MCLFLQGLMGEAGNLSGLGPANLASLIMKDMSFRKCGVSANLSTFLYNMGDNSSGLSSTCDMPGTALDFPWIFSFHLHIYSEESTMLLIIKGA